MYVCIMYVFMSYVLVRKNNLEKKPKPIINYRKYHTLAHFPPKFQKDTISVDMCFTCETEQQQSVHFNET